MPCQDCIEIRLSAIKSSLQPFSPGEMISIEWRRDELVIAGHRQAHLKACNPTHPCTCSESLIYCWAVSMQLLSMSSSPIRTRPCVGTMSHWQILLSCQCCQALSGLDELYRKDKRLSFCTLTAVSLTPTDRALLLKGIFH